MERTLDDIRHAKQARRIQPVNLQKKNSAGLISQKLCPPVNGKNIRKLELLQQVLSFC